MSLRLRQEVQTLSRSPELNPVSAPRTPHIDVVAGWLTDRTGRVLVGQRRAGTHMAGFWEFPGGKRRLDEGPLDALKRELREELGIVVLAAEFVAELTHRYPERLVHLELWRVDRFEGEPGAREGQSLAWVAPKDLMALPLLPADQPLVEALSA